tara:strand:- start:315 stop:1991 length:1677 start_codon:yes stop_codon:yes gene_type:complete
MGATYTRQSSTEIVTGEVINAADFNNEFAQLLSAFTASTGHSHDGTAAEGGNVTKLLGTAITIGDGTAGTDIAITFDGETSDGLLTWMEDEDHFLFSDDVVINSSKKLYLYDEGGEYISGDGTDLTLTSGADINLTATSDVNIPSGVGVTFGNDGEKIEGDGTDLTISGNNINLTATTNVLVAGTALAPSTASGVTLGSASLEWADLYMAEGGIIYFGADQEIKLTHLPDSGLQLKHTGTSDNNPIQLTIQTGETDMQADDVLGQIAFQAPDEGTGSDAILVAAAIQARSEQDFSASVNRTSIDFMTAASETATTKMTLSSGGNLALLTDSAVLSFGADSDVTITHDPDDGLFLKSKATADNNPVLLTLQTGETDIATNDVLGIINFQAPDEGTGSDAILVAAAIQARSEQDFSASVNKTSIDFMTGESEAATTKMTLSSAGNLDITGDLTISGDDLYMGTNTSGAALIADGTNFNPVVISGDATIATNGALTIAATAVEGSMLNNNVISGQTALTSGLSTTDELMVSDGGTLKRMDISVLQTLVAGDTTLTLAIALG